MSAAALLAELRAAGAELTVDPQGVRFRAPRPLPAALLAQARALRPELRRLLEQPAEPPAPGPSWAQLARHEAPGPELPPDVDPADPAAPSGPLEAPTPALAAGAARLEAADPAPFEAPELPAHLADTPEAWAAFLDCAPWAGPGERARILEGLGPGPAGAAPPPAPAPEPPAHLAGAVLSRPFLETGLFRPRSSCPPSSSRPEGRGCHRGANLSRPCPGRWRHPCRPF